MTDIPNTPTTPQPQIQNDVPVTLPEGTITKGEADNAWRNLLNHSSDPDSIRAAAKNAGFDLNSKATEQAPQQIPAQVSEAVAPVAYNLNFGPAAKEVPADALGAINSELNTGYKAWRISNEQAQRVTTAILDSIARVRHIADNKPALDLHVAETTAILARVVPDPIETKRLAGVALNALPKEIANGWRQVGAVLTAEAILQFAEVGRLLEARSRGHK